MFDLEKKPRVKSEAFGFPERNATFRSVEEYISNLSEITIFDVEKIPHAGSTIKTEEEFIEFLECLESLLINHLDAVHKQELFSQVHSNRDFFNMIEVILKRTPGFYYNVKEKRIEVPDTDIHRISSSIMNINTYSIKEVRKYISDDVYRYLLATANHIYDKCSRSALYDQWKDLSYDYFYSLADESDEEEGSYYAELMENLTNLDQMIGVMAGVSPKLKGNRKFTPDEQKIIDCCNRILCFDETVLYPFIDPDEYRDIHNYHYDEQGIEEWHNYLDERGPETIVSEYFNGLYVLGYEDKEDDCRLVNSYVDQINSYEQEGEWFVSLNFNMYTDKNNANVIDYDEAKKKIIDYYDAFIDLEVLLTKKIGWQV
jgi:hypothetical protein